MRYPSPVRACAFGASIASLIALAACHVSSGDAVVDLNAPYARIAYVSPLGEGEQTGRSPEDALPFSAVAEVLGASGDLAVMFVPGRYPLENAISVQDRGPGVRTAFIGEADGDVVFVGQAELIEDEDKFPGFRLSADNVKFENLGFERLGACISVPRDEEAHNVSILNISAADVHDCILVDAYQPRVATDWTVDGLEVSGFRRVAVRLAGVETSNIVLQNVVIDGANSFDRSDCYKGGVQILEGAHHITLRDVTIRNVVGDCGDEYGQGDGIEVHDRGGAPHDLLFENVTVENIRDGGFDLKGRAIRLVDVRSERGPLTRYAFRFWNYPGYSCEGCEADGADTALIFARNGSADVQAGRFGDLGEGSETTLCSLDPEGGRESETFVEFAEGVAIEGDLSEISCAAKPEAPASGAERG